MIAVAFVMTSAYAGTVYKSVGPDGKTIYSDQPPAAGKLEKTFDFSNLPMTPIPNAVGRENLQKTPQTAFRKAENADDMRQPVLFSAEWCRYCRQAKAYLSAKQIRYWEYDVDTPEGKRAFTEIGGRGIPVLLLNGQRIQGFSRAAYDAAFGMQR